MFEPSMSSMLTLSYWSVSCASDSEIALFRFHHNASLARGSSSGASGRQEEEPSEAEPVSQIPERVGRDCGYVRRWGETAGM